jgi:putative transposase
MFRNLPKFNDQSCVHYITTKTFENFKYFENEKYCLILLGELDFYRQKLGFKILGYVIMPDHLHCLIWWDVERYPELTISKIMQEIKSHSAKEILYCLKTGRRKPSLSPYSKGASEGSHPPNDYQWTNFGRVHTLPKTKIWQPDFYDFNIYTEQKFQEKLDYMHDNPRRAGLCENLGDYPWSSYKQFLDLDQNPILKIDFIEI